MMLSTEFHPWRTLALPAYTPFRLKKDLRTLLTDEMIELSKKQSDALETATYLTMSKAEAKAFDARCERMEKIRQLLGNPAGEL